MRKVTFLAFKLKEIKEPIYWPIGEPGIRINVRMMKPGPLMGQKAKRWKGPMEQGNMGQRETRQQRQIMIQETKNQLEK